VNGKVLKSFSICTGVEASSKCRKQHNNPAVKICVLVIPKPC